MVWVVVLAMALKVSIALIVLLAGLLGWSLFKKRS
jgi:chromate transport protein ChrA